MLEARLLCGAERLFAAISSRPRDLMQLVVAVKSFGLHRSASAWGAQETCWAAGPCRPGFDRSAILAALADQSADHFPAPPALCRSSYADTLRVSAAGSPFTRWPDRLGHSGISGNYRRGTGSSGIDIERTLKTATGNRSTRRRCVASGIIHLVMVALRDPEGQRGLIEDT